MYLFTLTYFYVYMRAYEWLAPTQDTLEMLSNKNNICWHILQHKGEEEDEEEEDEDADIEDESDTNDDDELDADMIDDHDSPDDVSVLERQHKYLWV